MGRKKSESTRIDKAYAFRLTESEHERIVTDMSAYGYKSFSKYVRESLLKTRQAPPRYRITDKNIRDQINRMTLEIKRIGVLYNQVVAKVNSLVNARRKNGEYVINSTYLKQYTDRLDAYMKEIIDKQNEVIRQVKNIEIKDNKPHNTTP